MRSLSRQEYEALVETSEVIEVDGYGIKVLKSPDGNYIKLFRRKHRLTTAWFRPYAKRFVANAARLKALGIPTVDVVDYAFCPEIQRHAVNYRPLPGVTLRELAASGRLDRPEFARFIAKLHGLGIYFRSIHLGNVIIDPNSGRLGLIDVADMTFGRGSLSWRKRIRNFHHMLRYPEDAEILCRGDAELFVSDYLAAAKVSPRVAARLGRFLPPVMAAATKPRIS